MDTIIVTAMCVVMGAVAWFGTLLVLSGFQLMGSQLKKQYHVCASQKVIHTEKHVIEEVIAPIIKEEIDRRYFGTPSGVRTAFAMATTEAGRDECRARMAVLKSAKHRQPQSLQTLRRIEEAKNQKAILKQRNANIWKYNRDKKAQQEKPTQKKTVKRAPIGPIVSVYLIRGFTNHKIGIAHDVVKRLKDLQTANEVELKIIQTMKGGDRRACKKIERMLHDKYNAKRSPVGNEWFNLSKSEVVAICEFMKANTLSNVA